MNYRNRYVCLLRGINVGGHHKVPMAELKKEFESLGFENVVTLLNSGNVIFDAAADKENELEVKIESRLETVFGFAIPVIVKRSEEILDLINNNPFKQIAITKDTQLYTSFLKKTPDNNLTLPWTSADGSFQILEVKGTIVCSVLDLAVTQSPKGMDALELLYGKNLTTRNWNTVIRISEKFNK